ncbi:MAG: hypothetical protein ABI175_12750 [Polyangiales bacterium]
MNRNKQRAVLAASFVLTTSSLASLLACGSSRKEPEYTHNPPMPTVMKNPPEPVATDSASAAPTGTLRPAPAGMKVIKGADGTCYADPDSGPCDPNETCNPPAPFQVQCPQ